jgi:hypothetical protein
LEALADAARKLSPAAYDSAEKIMAERLVDGAPLTNEEAWDLMLALVDYRLAKETKKGPGLREELRTMMQRMRRAPEPENGEPT